MKRLFILAMLAVVLVSSAQNSYADPIVYIANLSGPAESPSNNSPGTGFARVTFDITTHMMRVEVTFSGLTGTTTASHIHSATAIPGTGTAPVATQVPAFSGFPLGVTSGTLDATFDTSLLSFYNPTFVVANGGTAASAEAALASGLAAGKAYFNIHTTVFPGGEIRGFLQLQAVPEPATILLLGTGLAGVGTMVRRRRQAKKSKEV